MVDPIITYAFAIGFFVFILGSMLYLTFMEHPEDGRGAVGESVVGGVGAVERTDDQETAELAADATGDAEVEPRSVDGEATADADAEDEDAIATGERDGAAADDATADAEGEDETPTEGDDETTSETTETDEE